jgi:hypothetical protein
MRRSGPIAILMSAAIVTGLALTVYVASITPPTSRGSDLAFPTGVAVFTLVGALIVWRQPSNRVGWLFAAIGLLWVTGDLAGRYSTYAFLTERREGVFSWLGAWYGEWFWFVFLMLTFSLLPQLFPTGRPMPGRWEFFARAVFWFTVAVAAGAMLEDELVLIGTGVTLDNPIGLPGFHDIEEGPTALLLLVGGLTAIVVGLTSSVVRFRRSRGVERLQLKWFTVAVAVLIVQFVIQSFFGGERGHLYPVLDGLALALVPASAAIAILRYRLYDIDVVINRALVYAGLTAILAGTYLGGVVLLQALVPFSEDSELAVAGSTLAAAALFRPLKTRVQGFIDRRFYRHKYDAVETMNEFSSRLREQVDLDTLTGELVAVVGETMQPAHASLWLRTTARPEGSRA